MTFGSAKTVVLGLMHRHAQENDIRGVAAILILPLNGQRMTIAPTIRFCGWGDDLTVLDHAQEVERQFYVRGVISKIFKMLGDQLSDDARSREGVIDDGGVYRVINGTHMVYLAFFSGNQRHDANMASNGINRFETYKNLG